MTWDQIQTNLVSTSLRVTTFRALPSSNQSGVQTFSIADEQLGAVWSIDKCTGIDTSGTNGAGAIVTSGVEDPSTAGGECTTTFGAFSDSS
jgi:hypothetical protein